MRHLVIIGSGPAGTRAAFAAREFGREVTVIERSLTGGVCLNHGCIPTKMLLGGSEAVPAGEAMQALRLGTSETTPDFSALMARKDRFIKATRQAVEKQFAQAGIRLIRGSATLEADGVSVKSRAGNETEEEKEEHIACDGVIIATGSRAASFPGMEPDGECVLDSTGMLALSEVPQSLLIVGGGAIGIEMGEFFHRMGSSITIVEAMDRLAPTEDPEIGAVLGKHFSKSGWRVETGRKAKSLTTRDGKARLEFEDGTVLEATKALMAVGRQPELTELAPGKTLILNDRGWVSTDSYLRAYTSGSLPVYAVGDANGKTLLAHAAEHQARYAVGHVCGLERDPYEPPAMPACIYGEMECMRVGPTTEELVNKHGAKCIAVSRANLIANPIAQSHGATTGFIKISWVNDTVHSISAVGHNVTGLVGLCAIIASQRWKPEDVHKIIFAHPTLDEAVHDALKAPREAM